VRGPLNVAKDAFDKCIVRLARIVHEQAYLLHSVGEIRYWRAPAMLRYKVGSEKDLPS
jgi:hypothetical protein